MVERRKEMQSRLEPHARELVHIRKTTSTRETNVRAFISPDASRASVLASQPQLHSHFREILCEREREGLRASLTRRIRARKPMTRRDNHRARHRFARTIANQSRESLPETTRREKTYPLFILVIWRVCE